MADHMTADLDAFRLQMHLDLAAGARTLTVRDNEGKCPVVVALDEERLPVLLRRIENAGGYANVFTTGTKGVRHIAIMDVDGALDARRAERMTDADQPSPESTVGLFVDYLAGKKDGVVLPARLRASGAQGSELPPRQAELIEQSS